MLAVAGAIAGYVIGEKLSNPQLSATGRHAQSRDAAAAMSMNAMRGMNTDLARSVGLDVREGSDGVRVRPFATPPAGGAEGYERRFRPRDLKEAGAFSQAVQDVGAGVGTGHGPPPAADD